jgi:hyperosmotically inducible protein
MLKKCAVLLCTAALTVACGKSDVGITTAVKTKLAANDRVRAYDIDVTTRNHIVTLAGKVDTSAAKDEALKLTRETDGVRSVVDKLTVTETAATSGLLSEHPPEAQAKPAEASGQARGTAGKAGAALTDAAITSAVKTKLLADSSVGGMKIDVDTNNGVVTLTGSVTSRAEAAQAVKLAHETDGVKRVVDRLHVGGGN